LCSKLQWNISVIVFGAAMPEWSNSVIQFELGAAMEQQRDCVRSTMVIVFEAAMEHQRDSVRSCNGATM
jgi:hypothetical protein